MAAKNPKKVNLLDHHSIKNILDESVSEVVTTRGFVEDVRMGNIRLVLGLVIIVIALFAQFYKKKFPENKDFLIVCLVLDCHTYVIFNGLLQLIIYTKEKNAILFTYPPERQCLTQLYPEPLALYMEEVGVQLRIGGKDFDLLKPSKR
ncbi:putative signal peptidase complex subunit 2 [Tripterygium wilfordii]|uniref:Signal peptidase complex subunit 2 n=1 Tax=Tripterygium wilfordii TaxID=458696 RepID=A0A7J7E200_TRIWF|nr:putative signal peptidase complex subunit 2 [Tripterygium wilfordii]